MPILDSSSETLVIERRGIPYEDYIAWQTEQIELRKADQVPDTVSVMEFSNSVYTTPDNNSPKPIDLEEVILLAKRGGEDTWHGPGQLIIAPVVRLAENYLIKDVMDCLEGPVRSVLEAYGVVPDEHAEGDFPGVTVGGRKIAQIGLFLDGRVTSYGLAFNVTCDLTNFDAIDLCGIENCAVTNLASETSNHVDLNEVFDLLSAHTAHAFHYEDWLA